MARLRNLQVEFVSLVDKAAVRNPAKPDEPQRFLLTKSEERETMSEIDKAVERLAELEAGESTHDGPVMAAVDD